MRHRVLGQRPRLSGRAPRPAAACNQALFAYASSIFPPQRVDTLAGRPCTCSTRAARNFAQVCRPARQAKTELASRSSAVDVGHPAAQRLDAVRHSTAVIGVLEDDAVLRVSPWRNFLPISATRSSAGPWPPARSPEHALRRSRARHLPAGTDRCVLNGRLDSSSRHERQPARLRPVLERLPHDLFRRPPRHPSQPVDLRQIAVDQNLAHPCPGLFSRHTRRNSPAREPDPNHFSRHKIIFP